MIGGARARDIAAAVSLALGVLIGTAIPAQAQGDVVLTVLDAKAGTGQIDSIAFNRSTTAVIAHYSDGSILTWDLADKTQRLLAQTENAFAYCSPLDRLVIGTPTTAVLLSLADGGYTTLSEGYYDHAAFSGDCQSLALSEAASRAVELWDLSAAPQLRNAATLGPVRNGIALASDGQAVAAATASLLGDSSDATAIEIFRTGPDASLERTALVFDGQSALGLKAMAIAGSSAVIIGTQVENQAGLRALDGADGTTLWSWANLEGAWITALALGVDGQIVLSADDAGAVIVWRTESGARLASYAEPQPIDAMAISTDGNSVAIARRDQRIQILDLRQILTNSE